MPETSDEPSAFSGRRPWRSVWRTFGLTFAGLWMAHLPWLRLPYYWDEAGYFVPAAHDILTRGSLVPFSTLSNAHPPLVMLYLALAWKLFGFHHLVTRTAMLLVASAALTGLFCLARRVANLPVAVATVLCTALYPVFFAQSSLAHLDMMVAALVLWALWLYLPDRTGAASGQRSAWRRAGCVGLLALAAVTKETAILVPVVLCGWELASGFLARQGFRFAGSLCLEPDRSAGQSSAFLLALVPLAAWFAYHRARTGYVFGNPEYLRYNVGATLSAERVWGAWTRRVNQVWGHMNLWVLTLTGLVACCYRPRRPLDGRCPGIEPPVVALFVVLIAAHVVALSFVGGAVLARYLLPAMPLLILLWVAVIWRCQRWWLAGVAVVCAAFGWRCVVNPPSVFTWEDNLAYADFIRLHLDAARFIAGHEPGARVLTSWPGSNELAKPLLGYVERPVAVVPVENLRRGTLEAALAEGATFDAALVYSSHSGLKLPELRGLLGGEMVFYEERQGQWVAVLDRAGENAAKSGK